MPMDSFIGYITLIVLLGPIFLTMLYLLFKKDEGEQYNAAYLIGLRIKMWFTFNKDKRNAFKTRNGRDVYDVGGIEPDILIEKDKASNFVNSLRRNNIIFKYVNQYKKNHKTIPPVEQFEYTDFEDFKNFIKNIDYNYKTKTEKELDKLKKNLKDDGLESILQTKVDELTEIVKENKKNDLDSNKDALIRLIEKEIVKRYYFNQGKIKDSLKNDEEVKKAIEILLNKPEYDRILNIVKWWIIFCT